MKEATGAIATAAQAGEFAKIAELSAKPVVLTQAHELTLKTLKMDFNRKQTELKQQYQVEKAVLEMEKQQLTVAKVKETTQLEGYTKKIAQLKEEIAYQETTLSELSTDQIKQATQVTQHIETSHKIFTEKLNSSSQWMGLFSLKLALKQGSPVDQVIAMNQSVKGQMNEADVQTDVSTLFRTQNYIFS